MEDWILSPGDEISGTEDWILSSRDEISGTEDWILSSRDEISGTKDWILSSRDEISGTEDWILSSMFERGESALTGVSLCPNHDLTQICKTNQQDDKVRKSHLYLERR